MAFLQPINKRKVKSIVWKMNNCKLTRGFRISHVATRLVRNVNAVSGLLNTLTRLSLRKHSDFQTGFTEGEGRMTRPRVKNQERHGIRRIF
jgi:hypothetical protein